MMPMKKRALSHFNIFVLLFSVFSRWDL